MIGFDVSDDPARQGQISLRWRKLGYDENGALVETAYHRAVIDADTDLDAVLEAVGADLEAQGYGRPPQSDRSYIAAVAQLAHTPEVRAAVAEKRRAEKEEFDRQDAERKAREAEDAKAREAAFVEMADRLGFQRKPQQKEDADAQPVEQPSSVEHTGPARSAP